MFSAANVWNNIPNYIKEKQSSDTFKSVLKSQLPIAKVNLGLNQTGKAKYYRTSLVSGENASKSAE